MSSGTQIDLDWAAIDAAQGGEGAAGAGGARGTGAHAPAEPSTYRSDEEILGIDPPSPNSGYGGLARQSLDDGGQAGDANTRAGAQTAGSQHTAANKTDAGAEKNTAQAAANDTEDLRAFREMFPGGATEAVALREAAREVESLREAAREVESLRQSAQELRQSAQAVDQIDAAIFSGDARAQSQVVADIARANPAAFRQLFAEAARVLAGMNPPPPGSGYGGLARQSLSDAGLARHSLDDGGQARSESSLNTGTSSDGSHPSLRSGQADHASASPGASGSRDTLRQASGQAGHPPTLKDGFGGQASPGFDPTAYASFERGTNDAVARDVRAAIGDTLGRVLPDGIADGAARRIGDDIFNEIHRTLAADRTLSEQVGDVLRAPVASGQGWRFGAAEQQRVASLLAGRARQLVPGVARRVVGEWTSSVLGTARSKAARQAAAAARVDIAAPGGSLDSMPLRPIAARGVDYTSMSDDEILSS